MAMKMPVLSRLQLTSVLRASAAITTETGRVCAAAREDHREHEFRVAEHEGEKAGRADRRQGQRHGNAPEGLEPAAVIEHRRLEDLGRNLAEEDREDEHREGQRLAPCGRG